MRIAMLAPLWETIPPKCYGGTELVVYLLTEELIRQGHEVMLFAAGQSQTSATLNACTDTPLRELKQNLQEALAWRLPSTEDISVYPGSALSIYFELQMLATVCNQAQEFDVIHNHLGFPALAFASLITTPLVTTLHGTLESYSLQHYIEKNYYESFAYLPYVSISNEQRKPAPHLNYAGTVYHGLDVQAYDPSFTYNDKSYLAFLGRFCPEKGPHHAIRIAKETGWKLVMAGKVDFCMEKDFFKKQIEPYIDGDQIQFVGELNHSQKVQLLRNAAATLCPVNWSEPFGLVLTESMACGTPVLALGQGSIPEIIVDGKTGFVAQSVNELIQCVSRIPQIDRRICRHHVENHFSVERMTQDYIQIYEKLILQAATRFHPETSHKKRHAITTDNKPVKTLKHHEHQGIR